MGLLTILLSAVFLLIAVISLFLFYKNLCVHLYFKKRRVPYTGFGVKRMAGFLTGKLSLVDIELMLYKESIDTKSPFVGLLDAFSKPAIYLTDLDLVRHIFVKDFDHFVNRRKFTTNSGDILFKKMFISMENEEWRGMRSKLSPTFTTGKIRRMYSIFERSCNRMSDYVGKLVGASGKNLDVSHLFSKYTMDVIASCAFGVDSKAFEFSMEEMSPFEEMGIRSRLDFTPLKFVKVMLTMAAPKLADMLGIEAVDLVPQRYFQKVVKDVMAHRRVTGERQDDFLQLMMDTQEGLLKSEENTKETLEVMSGSGEGELKSSTFSGAANIGKVTMDDDHIAANAVLFLSAGFDTLQSLLQFTVYTLALNQDVQEKLVRKIKEAMEENGGKLTYDMIHSMEYLDMVINETLRFLPPATRTERVCTKDYQIPGTDFVIEKGTIVVTPFMGIHRDSRYYKNPDKFDPERFSPEGIGMRFALTEAKAVIANFILKYKLEPCDKTEIPLKFGKAPIIKPQDGIMLNIKPRAK